MPIKDVIRMGAHASHHLAVFDKATGAALNYLRARRTASPAQRIMLIARDGAAPNRAAPSAPTAARSTTPAPTTPTAG